MGYNNIGVQWNDTEIRNKILEVVSALNIDRMPSNTEIIQVLKSSGLSNAIRRRGGLYKWSKKMGLSIKKSETQTGKGFEEVAIKMLNQRGYEIIRMTTKYPFDLLVNNNISIDVKAARPVYNGERIYVVGLNKKYATCDLYLILLLDETDNVEKTLIIPGNKLKQTSLNLGRNLKYNQYIDRWDYIDQYSKFYESLK